MFIKFSSTTYTTHVNTRAPMVWRCILIFHNKMLQYFSPLLNVTPKHVAYKSAKEHVFEF
jgi:hypothetical protein